MRRAACLRSALGGSDAQRRAPLESREVAKFLRQQGVPATCLPQCTAALQSCVGPLGRHTRIGCAPLGLGFKRV